MNSAEDYIQKMHVSKFISKMDLSKGYWQIPMAEEDIHKTAFVVPQGHYEFLRMPFGLVNSGTTLVRGLRKLLADVPNANMYVDDVIIHSRTWEEHLKSLKEVFNRFKTAGLTIKPSKCEFGKQEIEFIGHKIVDGKVTPLNDNVKKIVDSERPKTKKEVQSFLGLSGFIDNTSLTTQQFPHL